MSNTFTFYRDGDESPNIEFLAKELESLSGQINEQQDFRDHKWTAVIYEFENGRYDYTLKGAGDGNTEKVFIQRSIQGSAGELVLKHDMFAISASLQGKGMSSLVMESSLNITDRFKLNKINVSANLDVGGYTWFRKGAYPPVEDGRDQLLGIARRNTNPHDDAQAALLSKLKTEIGNKTLKERKLFVLSPEFRKYKPLYLGSTWRGSFDIEDQVVRQALKKGADSAYVLAKKNQRTSVKPIVKKPVSTNDEILDSYIRHQTFVMRYGNGLTREQMAVLEATENALEREVLFYANSAPNRTLTGKAGRAWQTALARGISDIRDPAWAVIADDLQNQLTDFASSEASGAAIIIEGAVPVLLNMNLPQASHLRSIINSQPFEGRTLKQWAARTNELDVQRILAAAKIGIIQGRTPSQVVRDVMGTRAAGYKDGVMRKAFRDMEAVILTLTNGIQQEAKQALYAANADIVEKETYVATLDASTTLICASNDGKVFPRGEGPIPPLHFRCRSLRVPVIDPDLVTIRGADPSTEKTLVKEYSKDNNLDARTRGELPRGTKGDFDKFAQKRRRELIGQVPANTSYNEWLKKQSVDFQNEVLGVKKGEIFRKGGVTLEKFVARDGSNLTLNELQKKGLTPF